MLKAVRERLHAKQPCRVVSTQLVEAGVDLDFPTVYRAEAGFDSIAQAAGRCNREGKLPLGFTYVFETDERPPAGFLRAAADTAKELQSKYPDPLDPEAVEDYFKQFYWTQKSRWDQHRVMETMAIDKVRGHALFQFREMAKAFRMIRDEQSPVLVAYNQEAQNLWENLSTGRVPFVQQRHFQPYLVSVRKEALVQMQLRGFVTEHESGVWLLLNRSLYSPTKGLDVASTRLDESLWGV